VLGTFGRLVLELGESMCDLPGHEYVDGGCGVDPTKSETE
jgi:hypothetical protein